MKKNQITKVWGLKLGKPTSREAYTANWVIAALSDFWGQLQARDVVRLIRFASEKALQQKEYSGSEEIDQLEKLGIVTKESGKYYMPEIFRRGLGFGYLGGARPKVLSLLKKSLRG